MLEASEARSSVILDVLEGLKQKEVTWTDSTRDQRAACTVHASARAPARAVRMHAERACTHAHTRRACRARMDAAQARAVLNIETRTPTREEVMRHRRRRHFVELVGAVEGRLAVQVGHDAHEVHTDAREEPVRLGGACTSLELMPELHAIGAAAYAIASASDPALARAIAVRGSIYDLATLQTTCAGAAVVYAYATKFESSDGVHVERLSAALAASALPADTVVVTVNRRLRAADGWEEAAPPLAGAVPHETAEQGTAFFWRQSRRTTPATRRAE
jgi:hypothetical protein